MYKLFTDKAELFECDIKVEGTSLSKSKARLVVETSDYSLMFNGSIDSSGKCKVPIRKLKGLIDETSNGNVRLEILKLLVRENINLENLELKKDRVNRIIAVYNKHKPLPKDSKSEIIEGILEGLGDK
jgi:hypothetical protein